jgi:hypothetical protein
MKSAFCIDFVMKTRLLWLQSDTPRICNLHGILPSEYTTSGPKVHLEFCNPQSDGMLRAV